MNIDWSTIVEKVVTQVLFLIFAGVIFVATTGYAAITEIDRMAAKISELETLTDNLKIDDKGRFLIEVDSLIIRDAITIRDREEERERTSKLLKDSDR